VTLAQREALTAVGGFAAALAHEIRNPLTSIRIDLQRIEEALPAESLLRLPLARALREVGRLDRTVSGALRIARSGQVGSDVIDLRLPLRRAAEVAASAFEQSGSILDAGELDSHPIPVRGNESALEQVFLNLLLTAAQALDRPGRGTVRALRQQGAAHVIFTDSGNGITPMLLARVFDPFVSTKPDGTGLGLPIARQIVMAHGGTIAIESSPGEGTTVRVILPLL